MDLKNHDKRRVDIFEGVLPPADSLAHKVLTDRLDKERAENPALRKVLKENFKKASKSLEAQSLSHCNFLTETTIRHFLKEFNVRAWHHGLRSMPVMFNILESFFTYRKPHIYFELLEEENYLISFYNFLDFITSNKFNSDKQLIEDNLTNNLVFNFNIGSDVDTIKFKTEDGCDFIIAGISIIRRENEVTVLLITGKKGAGVEKFLTNEIELDFKNPEKGRMFKDFNKKIQDQPIECEYIDKNKEYTKVLVACRIDLDSNTVDGRYIAQEYSHMFSVVTDEIESFINNKGEFKCDDLREAFENSIKKIEEHNAVIEVAKIALYLPYFLNSVEDDIIEETHETEFYKEYFHPLKRREFRDTFGSKYYQKPLFVIGLGAKQLPDLIKIKEDLFTVETSGYWKKISIDEIGTDKNGAPIHGKTWVTKHLSWFQSKTEELIVKKDGILFSDPNSGFIYILRNPVMGANVFKIGLTTNTVGERANQLSKTSVPDRFYIVQEWNVKDCFKAEKDIHKILSNYSVDPRREFFSVQLDIAIATINDVVLEINT